jgi:hypothetical protein
MESWASVALEAPDLAVTQRRQFSRR